MCFESKLANAHSTYFIVVEQIFALRVDKTPLSSDYSLARYLPRDVVQLYSTKHLYINQFRAAGDVFDFCFNES